MSDMIHEESTSGDFMELMESPDLNRFTSTPRYREPLAVPLVPSTLICPTQFYVMDEEEWSRPSISPSLLGHPNAGFHGRGVPYLYPGHQGASKRKQGNDVHPFSPGSISHPSHTMSPHSTGSSSRIMSPARQMFSPSLMSPNKTVPRQDSPQPGVAIIMGMKNGEALAGEQEELENTKKKTKKLKNPLGHFLEEEKNKLVNKSAKLDYSATLEKWRSLDGCQQDKYQKLFEKEREQKSNHTKPIIKRSEKTKEDKKERDRQYMAYKRQSACDKLKEEQINHEKLKVMVKTKTEKISKMNARTETKKSELLYRKTELETIDKEIKAKETEEMEFKDKYKAIYKHHNGCSQKQ